MFLSIYRSELFELLITNKLDLKKQFKYFFRNGQVLSSTLRCKPIYQPSDKKVYCYFNLHNNGDDPIWVSKWFTPLEGIKSSCLKVMQNGKKVEYDGTMIYRLVPPPSRTFVRISSKGTVSAKFDLSDSYSINEPGKYSVSVDLKSLYIYMNSSSIEKKKSPHTFP